MAMDQSSCGRLAGEVVFITGATTSLGTAIAVRCGREGASVAVAGRDRERGDETIRRITSTSDADAVFIPIDLRDWESASRAVIEASERLGAVSVVVNGAKGNDPIVDPSLAHRDDSLPAVEAWKTGDGTVVSADPRTWQSLFDVNVFGTAAVCRAAIPIMVERGGGSIVNISSRVAERGTPALAVYSASKGAVNALTRSIATDFGKQGIRCNAIAVGYVEHEERDRSMDPDRRAFFEAQHLTVRLGTPADVASAVVYLASREADFITGEVLFVDGGGASSRGRVVG